MADFKRKRLRDLIYKRDLGVCAVCRFDPNRELAKAKALAEKIEKPLSFVLAALKKQTGIDLLNYWDADHIVPIAEGGEDSLDNIQTLCHECHALKTKEQTNRRGRIPKKIRHQIAKR